MGAEHADLVTVVQGACTLQVHARWHVDNDPIQSWWGELATSMYELGPAELHTKGGGMGRILIHGAEVVDVTPYGAPWREVLLGSLVFTGTGPPPEL